MIAIGKSALVNAHTIKHAIVDALAVPAPPVTGLTGPVQPTLSDAHAIEAAEFNERKVRDVRSVRAIQRTLGLPFTGAFDQDTSQALVPFQQANVVASGVGMGKIDDATFYELVRSIAMMGGEDSAIRLIVDYRRIPEDGVLDASLDMSLRAGRQAGYVIDQGRAGGNMIRFEPALFTDEPETIVMKVAQAYEEVRLGRTTESGERQAFLIAKFTVLAPGMAWEELNAFMVNVAQVPKAWADLKPGDQRSFAGDLADIQDMLRRHWDAGPEVEKPAWTEVHAKVQALRAP